MAEAEPLQKIEGECDGFGKDHRLSDGRFFNPWNDKAKNLGINSKGQWGALFRKVRMSRRKDDVVPNSHEPAVLD